MDRLTERINDNCVQFKTKDYGKIADTLCKYEDTGLEPKEIEHYAITLKNNNYKDINGLLLHNTALQSELDQYKQAEQKLYPCQQAFLESENYLDGGIHLSGWKHDCPIADVHMISDNSLTNDKYADKTIKGACNEYCKYLKDGAK